MSQTTVADIMSKGVVSLSAEEEIGLASEVMELGRIRHLPVVKGGRLLGLVTHRDLLIAQAHLLTHLGSENDETTYVSATAADIMTTGIRTVHPDTPAVQAAEILVDHKIGCLPVIEDERLVGIVTEADFLKWTIRELQKNESP
ncbi:MAG: CBS domain-containing protein [Myxococcales bacterium]|nr:MAG: CBS domain-containing protein [Myxococcales bacterium]